MTKHINIDTNVVGEITDEYDLQGAGVFNELDLLEFRDAELAKGRTVRKIWISRIQANHLANSIDGTRQEPTGKKLVDYWDTPAQPINLKSVHGIEIGVDL